MMRQILILVRKDLLIEWRLRYAISGILLHVVGSIFITYLAIRFVNPATWNALFWIIMLFTSVSAIAKSFISESQGRHLYFYGVASPMAMILSRIIYNVLLMILVALLSLGVYMVIMGNEVSNAGMFALCALLGCIGFASTFTLLSAIASKASNSNLLMPVLSLPIIVPLFLVLIKASKKAVDGMDFSLVIGDLGVLLALNLVIVALAALLYPFLWKH